MEDSGFRFRLSMANLDLIGIIAFAGIKVMEKNVGKMSLGTK